MKKLLCLLPMCLATTLSPGTDLGLGKSGYETYRHHLERARDFGKRLGVGAFCQEMGQALIVLSKYREEIQEEAADVDWSDVRKGALRLFLKICIKRR